MWNEEKWKKWLAWHHDWKQRRDEEYKMIKRHYKGDERKEIMERTHKIFMQEFWDERKKILGF